MGTIPVIITRLKVQGLSRQLAFLPWLACRPSSVFFKFKAFAKISRCLFFLILCSRNLPSLFDLPIEAVLQCSKVSSLLLHALLSPYQTRSSVLNSCFMSLLYPPVFHVFMECYEGLESPGICQWVFPLPCEIHIISCAWEVGTILPHCPPGGCREELNWPVDGLPFS